MDEVRLETRLRFKVQQLYEHYQHQHKFKCLQLIPDHEDTRLSRNKSF